MTDYMSMIESGLQQRGLSFDQARGVAAGISAESGGIAFNINPTSGAFGIGQWLGPRKAGLIATYGPAPSLDNQLDYLVKELRGGDPGGKSVLAASGQGNILAAYITKFMRPAAGAETTGDLTRGNAYLAGGSGGDAAPDFLASAAQTVGNAASSLIGGLDPSAWFQRIALAILAIILIAIALGMLSAKPVAAIASKVPVPIP